MKKFLNISVIAALAILPLAAHATDLTSEQLAKANIVADDATRVATTGYVKGAYTELATAVNSKQDKLSADDLAAIQNVSGIDSRLTTAEGKITTAEGKITTAEGKISTLETAVGDANSGLTKAVADNTTAISTLNTTVADKADTSTVTALDGRVTTAEGKITTLETASATHATQTGVTATITASSVTVPVLATWGSTTTTTVDGNITGAAYTAQ